MGHSGCTRRVHRSIMIAYTRAVKTLQGPSRANEVPLGQSARNLAAEPNIRKLLENDEMKTKKCKLTTNEKSGSGYSLKILSLLGDAASAAKPNKRKLLETGER
jgi:hypothetical protein